MGTNRIISMYPPGFSTGDVKFAQRGDISGVPRLLRTILVADGTVTKLLEAYLWEPIDVTLIAQHIVLEDPFDFGNGPIEVAHRDVILVSRVGQRVLAFARSRIILGLLEPDLRAALMRGDVGIGALLRERRLETYREHISVSTRTADDLATVLGVSPESAVAERTFRIHHKQKPLMQISEVFPLVSYLD